MVDRNATGGRKVINATQDDTNEGEPEKLDVGARCFVQEFKQMDDC